MKIICPYCDEILDVDDGALSTKCTHCEKELDMANAKQYSAQKFKEYQNIAYNSLYVTLDYQTAWDNYTNCLMLKENDLSSIMGLCLAKTSMATFEKTYFEEVEKIIDKFEIYLDLENTFLFLNFIKDMLDQINFYYTEATARIVKDGTYINKIYFDEYIRTTKEIKKLLKYFEDSFKLMDEKELKQFKEQNENFMPRLEGRKTDVNNRLNCVYNVNHIGDVEYKDGEQVSIDESKKVDIEKDTLDNINLTVINYEGIKLKKIFLPLIGIFGVLTLALVISYFSTKINALGYTSIGTLVATIGLYIAYAKLFKKTIK